MTGVSACEMYLSPQKKGWSGQQDLNLRPGVPETPALPNCAMPRRCSTWAFSRFTLVNCIGQKLVTRGVASSRSRLSTDRRARHQITRALFEQNMQKKLTDPQIGAAAEAVGTGLIKRLPGEPWKGVI